MNESLRRASKLALALCVVGTGGARLLRRRTRGWASQPLVLGYHGIASSSDYPGRSVGTEIAGLKASEFGRQMRWVARNRSAISLDHMTLGISNKRGLPARPVCVTFDDGYDNIYTHAFPILQRYSAPATVFLITGQVGKRDVSLTWEQVREMHRNGITFGAHTVTHPCLPQESVQRQRMEILESKASIEDHLGVPINLFSYPYGAFNQRTVDIVMEAGFLSAVTTLHGSNRPGSNPFVLKRWMVGGENYEPFCVFVAREAGLFDLYRRETPTTAASGRD